MKVAVLVFRYTGSVEVQIWCYVANLGKGMMVLSTYSKAKEKKIIKNWLYTKHVWRREDWLQPFFVSSRHFTACNFPFDQSRDAHPHHNLCICCCPWQCDRLSLRKRERRNGLQARKKIACSASFEMVLWQCFNHSFSKYSWTIFFKDKYEKQKCFN